MPAPAEKEEAAARAARFPSKMLKGEAINLLNLNHHFAWKSLFFVLLLQNGSIRLVCEPLNGVSKCLVGSGQ